MEIRNSILIWFTTTVCPRTMAILRLQAWAKSHFSLLLV
jgi:hypothetical protein